jgi:hypothetical protein
VSGDETTDAGVAGGAVVPQTAETAVHACPPGDTGIMPCCGKTPFEVPRSDRMATDPGLVTCWTGSDPRLSPVGGEG